VNRLLRTFEEAGAVDLRRGEIEVIEPAVLPARHAVGLDGLYDDG
jgi:hypothetical protein